KTEARARLFLFDRLANRVQDEQELIRRRDAAEHIHLLQDLELPIRHLVTRQHPAIAHKLAPRGVLRLAGRRLSPLTDDPLRLRMREQEQPLLVEIERIRQPRQQRQRWTAPSVLEIRDVAGLDAEFARKFTLSEGISTAPLFEDLTESFFFHSLYSASSAHRSFA